MFQCHKKLPREIQSADTQKLFEEKAEMWQ